MAKTWCNNCTQPLTQPQTLTQPLSQLSQVAVVLVVVLLNPSTTAKNNQLTGL